MRYIFVELSIPNNPVISTSISTYDGSHKSQCIFRTNYAKLLESCDSDNTLTILCQIKLPGPVTSKVIEARKSMKQAFDTQKGQWCQDFRRLLEESKFTDFALLVGTHKFPAHKLVLAARSSVFSAMFAHEETEENLKNEVKIENMEPATIQAMLEFFYTDKVTNLEELAHDLLEAADKYDVPLLRSMCEEVLYATVNAENAAEILILADLHRSPKLKEHVMGFMADHLRHAVESDSYKVMEEVYPSLTKELMRFIAVNK
ncbi:speckle-type POZ protein A [Diachasma alloeum]|uniref:speckle-type POZ protein A n=1 Tax=Diachasma alloeum TaxID=454923 RepID=UPI0007381F44|nr:speckle-type POZ protein A [Diachasma alloeum]